MSDEHSPWRGPLDELAPHLREAPEALPRDPVHPRVLSVDGAEGRSLLLAVWEDPGAPVVLFNEILYRLEGTLLSELSTAPARLDPEQPPLVAVRLAVFSEIATNLDTLLAPFALRRCEARGAPWRSALARLRHEAQLTGRAEPDEPTSTFEARTDTRDERADRLRAAEDHLRAVTDEVWGESPGQPFERLCRHLSVAPTLDGLRALEPLVASFEPNVLRPIPPLVFQAVCDGVAGVAMRELDMHVEWAVCEPDETGFAPPPLVRVRGQKGYQHVPLGHALLRWWVMPLRDAEKPAPLADWVVDQFQAVR